VNFVHKPDRLNAIVHNLNMNNSFILQQSLRYFNHRILSLSDFFIYRTPNTQNCHFSTEGTKYVNLIYISHISTSIVYKTAYIKLPCIQDNINNLDISQHLLHSDALHTSPIILTKIVFLVKDTWIA